MSEVTVRQLAEVIGIPVERLIEQFSEVGLGITKADATVSNSDKMALLEFLQKNHGKDDPGADGPKKITLKRKSRSELRMSGSAGRSKTVNVEVRKKRTYVKRSVVAEQDKDDPYRQEAQRKLDEVRTEREVEEKARQMQEDDRKRTTEEMVREADTTHQDREQELENAKAREVEEAKQLEADEKVRKEEAEAEVKRQEAEKLQQKEQARLIAEQQAAASKTEAARKTKAKAKPGTRYGRKELHVDASKRGRRRSGGTRRPSYDAPEKHGFSKPTAPVVRDIELSETLTVQELAQKMAVKSGEVIKELMKMGMMVTINQPIDRDTATLVVEEMGHSVKSAVEKDIEAKLVEKYSDEDNENLVQRPPVITIMGHVDHGKTSLLDYIRESRVADGEAGGITQHIGAYHVETPKGVISFLDTPGHAAFSAMRARGAKATDIVVLVIAGDDGVKPQTEEAIKHARAAGVPLIVAINKMDREGSDAERVKQELTAYEVVPEEWGGEDIFVNVSAKTGEGVDALLEAISLQAEVLELKADPTRSAMGVVVESSLDKGRGPVATILIQNGTLKKGDILLAGSEFGRVRAMYDENGLTVESAGPSIPVQILGLSGTPMAGETALVVEREREARDAAAKRELNSRDSRLAQQQAAKLDSLFTDMSSGESKQVNLLVKADVQGSAEALKDSLLSLSNDEVKVSIVASGVGGITESDATLAQASNAILIGFNTRADAAARRVVKENGQDLRYYSIIYEVIDDVKMAITGLLGSDIREEILGLAEVKDVFRSSSMGPIAGSLVLEGVVRRDSPIRVLRNDVVVYEGELESLRRFKDDVKEVVAGTECGIGVKAYNDVQPGDHIECFDRIEVKRTLD